MKFNFLSMSLKFLCLIIKKNHELALNNIYLYFKFDLKDYRLDFSISTILFLICIHIDIDNIFFNTVK